MLLMLVVDALPMRNLVKDTPIMVVKIRMLVPTPMKAENQE